VLPPWNLINDDLSNYTAGWTAVITNGTVTQNSGTVTIIDTSHKANYLVKNNAAPTTGTFTFEVIWDIRNGTK
jgi:hypothetical protein